MNWLRRLSHRFRALFAKRRLDEEMDEEMRAHIELQTQENMANGMPPEEARFAALRQFGHVEGIKETCRERRGWVWLETFLHDLRFSVRALRKNLLGNGVIVITIAILIGVVSVLFASLREDRARLEPFPEPDRLVKLWRMSERRKVSWFPGAQYKEYSNRLTSFAGMGAVEWRRTLTLTGVGEPISCSVASVTPSVFRLAGLGPVRGRLFDEAEDAAGSERLILISEQLWREKLEADPDIIGRELLLDDRADTVIGVMPADMRTTYLGSRIDVWRMLRADQARQSANLTFLVARLRTGVTLPQAQAELDTLAPRIENQYPPNNPGERVSPDGFKSVRVAPLGKVLRTEDNALLAEQVFMWVFAVTILGCVVGIACFNITNLLLARYRARSREIAIRLSLGARRLRIVRQLLTESVLLAFLGGILGLLTSLWLLSLLRFQHINPRFDGRLYLIAFLGTLLLGIGFGLAPAIRSSRRDLMESLKEGGLAIGGRRRHRLSHFLVSSEVAMASVLCVASGLMIRSFIGFYGAQLGFDPDRIVTVNVRLRPDRYREQDDQIAYIMRGLQALREVPGIEAASVSLGALTGFRAMGKFSLPDRSGSEDDFHQLEVSRVSPGFSEMYGMPVLRGRPFPESGPPEPGAVLVNESFVARFFPNSDPIGREIRPQFGNKRLTIVGVLRDRHPLTSYQTVEPEIFRDFRDSFANNGLTFVAKTRGDAKAMAALVRETLVRLDLNQPVDQPNTASELLFQRVAATKAAMILLSALAGFGLLIALTGVYGVVSFSVVERTREVGIRMAVGATQKEILRLILWQGARLMIVGVPLGLLVGTLVVSGLPEGLFAGGSPRDIPTQAMVLLLVGFVGGLASLLPARRATQINPMDALRTE